MYINSVTLAGRLASDIQRKTSGNDLPILKFRIAVPKYKKGETSFFDVVMFGKPATWFDDMEKGEAVTLTGELQQEEYEKDGKKITYYSIVANSLIRHSWKKKEESNGDGRSDQESRPDEGSKPSNTPKNDGGFNDDIPF